MPDGEVGRVHVNPETLTSRHDLSRRPPGFVVSGVGADKLDAPEELLHDFAGRDPGAEPAAPVVQAPGVGRTAQQEPVARQDVGHGGSVRRAGGRRR